MFERLRKNLTESNYGPLGLEIVVVILGILIAFQIDRWAEERRDRTQEYDYLLRLKEDLQIEIRGMDKAIQYAEDRLAAVLLLEEVIANPSIVEELKKIGLDSLTFDPCGNVPDKGDFMSVMRQNIQNIKQAFAS